MDLTKSIQNTFYNIQLQIQLKICRFTDLIYLQIMDALVAYGSGSEESDNGKEQQQKQKQASREGGDISKEIPGFFTYKDKMITD
jgi:hypothetical protein